MPIDPSIPLSIRPPAPGPSVLDTYSQILQLQGQRAQAQERTAAAADAQAKRQREAQIEQALAAGISIDPVTKQPTFDYEKALGRQLPPAVLFEVKKVFDANAEQMAKLQTANLTAEEKKAVYLAGTARSITAAGYDPDVGRLEIGHAKRIGALDAGLADQLLDAIDRDGSEALQQFAAGALARAGKTEEAGFTLGPGQVRYGPGGEQIAAGPPREAPQTAGFTLGPGQIRYGPDGEPIAEGPARAGPDPVLAELRQMQLDAAKKAAESGGNWTPKQIATFNQIAGAYDRSPLVRAGDRTIVLRDAVAAAKKDPTNPANQLSLAYGFIQALDTYQSAVREGELQNLGMLATRWQQLALEANRVATTGAFMPPGVAREIAASAEQLVRTIESGRQGKVREFGSRAKVSGVGDMWDQFVAGAGIGGPPPQETSGGTTPTPAGPPVGTRRTIKGQLAEWDGKGWKAVANAAR